MQLIGKAVSVRSVLLSLSAILFRKYKSVKSGEEVAGGGRFSVWRNILKNEQCNVQQSKDWQTLQGLIVLPALFRNHKGSRYCKIYAAKNQQAVTFVM